jgi:nucleotide-binding universal stress UspA family protein
MYKRILVPLDGSTTAERGLREAIAHAREQGVKADTMTCEMARRRIPAILLKEAERAGCDLIVMGTHGRRGFSHMVLGSAAEGVVRASTIPVLLVREQVVGEKD